MYYVFVLLSTLHYFFLTYVPTPKSNVLYGRSLKRETDSKEGRKGAGICEAIAVNHTS